VFTPTDKSPQELEATLHCIMSIQEAVPLEANQHLLRLFSPDVLGQLPASGGHRIRRTVLGLIGTFFLSFFPACLFGIYRAASAHISPG